MLIIGFDIHCWTGIDLSYNEYDFIRSWAVYLLTVPIFGLHNYEETELNTCSFLLGIVIFVLEGVLVSEAPLIVHFVWTSFS